MPERGERRWVLVFALVAMLVLSLPYLLGFFTQGSDWQYSGLLLAAEDGYSYLAKMMRGASGDCLFRTPYTIEAQNGFLAFLPYLLLGKLTSPPGQYEQMVALFHLFRYAGGVLAILVTYDLVSLYVAETRWRRFALMIITLGGGLGFLSLVGLDSLWLGPMPLEFYSPESFGFFGLLAIPHLPWARALFLWGIVRYLRAQRWQDGLAVGLIWLIMGLFQPLTVAVAWAVVGAFLAALAIMTRLRRASTWGEWLAWMRVSLAAGIVSAPIVVYNIVSFQIDPFLKRWQAQNILPSPPAGDYLLAYGLALIPLGVGVWHVGKKASVQNLFLLAWLGAFPILAYLPYNLQRRLLEGIWVAIGMLAVQGLMAMRPAARKSFALLMSLGFLPSLVLLAGGINSTLHAGRPLFVPSAEASAYLFIQSQASKDDVMLASYDTSTILPAYAPVLVPIGHGPESLGLHEIQPRVEQFYAADQTDAYRSNLLAEFQVRFVFWGERERQLGGWDPNTAGYLTQVYAQDGFAVFEVVNLP